MSKTAKDAPKVTNCDDCMNYEYDDDSECYVCVMDLDEDDMVRFLTGQTFQCPFYRCGNEYAIVKKQM